jgi:hypothetical protein
MSEVRAFVGHSFLEGDATVVGAFLKYFSQLSRSGINFTWENAEPAEPKVLAEKVKKLMTDKNTFIGICTQREHIILPGFLKSAFLPRSLVGAKQEQFLSRTSD